MKKAGRRFWQIHLSTAIVLMLSSGGLIAANLTHRERRLDETTSHMVFDFVTGSFESTDHHVYHEWGWPYSAAAQCIQTTTTINKKLLPEVERQLAKAPAGPSPIEIEWRIVAINVGVALATLCCVAIILELFARRNVL